MLRDLYDALDEDYIKVCDRFCRNDKLLIRFLKKLPEDDNYEKLCQGLGYSDYDSAIMCVHTLKGLHASLGFSRMADCCNELLCALRNNEEVEQINLKFDRLKAEYLKVNKELKKLLEENCG